MRPSLAQRILASAVPVPTPDLVAAHGGGSATGRSKVWNALRQLLDAGLVAQELRPVGAGEGWGRRQTLAFWTAAGEAKPCG